MTLSFQAHNARDVHSAGVKHSIVVRAFHWGSAVILAGMYALAWTAGAIGPGQLGVRLFDLHRSFGVVLIALVVLRLVWRLTHPLPPLPETVTSWERIVSSMVQALLYGGMILMPLLGLAASDMAGDTIRIFGLVTLPSVMPMDQDLSDFIFEVHGWVAIGLLGFIGLHVLGALRHHFVLKDAVLVRMVGGKTP